MKLAMVVLALTVCCAAFAQETVVWTASPWQHVLQGDEPGPGRSIDLRCAKNEYEPFRLIIRAGTGGLKDVMVEVTDFTGPKGVIEADNITLYRAHYLHVFEPSLRSTAQPGWYPDALIPFIDPATGEPPQGGEITAAPFDILAGDNQEVWGDVYVPHDTPAGAYEGKVTVMVGAERLARLPINLQVWDFALPDTIAMRSNFGSLGSRVAKAHGMEAGTEEFVPVEDRYIDELLSHRAIPRSFGNVWPEFNAETGELDSSATHERLRALIEDKHVNALNMQFPYRDEPEKCKAYLRATAAYLREHGWLEMAYIYLKDEPNNAEEYEIVRQQAALIHEADPEILRLCTEQTLTSNPEWGDLYGAVDIWCPLWGLWDEKTAKQRLKQGEELWSYTALCQRDERNPFWQIDFAPITFRAPFWVSWTYDVTGFLYWSSVYWGDYEDVYAKPHFRDKYWGEGMLLYPGPPAGVQGPVPSIRLKLIREALEDYEYMTLAGRGKSRGGYHAPEMDIEHFPIVPREAGGTRVDAMVRRIAPSFLEWSRNPDDYERARAELARMIERM